ncbi:MAG: SAM-dependent methyltransferase, partial [Desulfatitalea sp.]|nr:SAM-dependent methyltransferase [Desulfatitalea sp.]
MTEQQWHPGNLLQLSGSYWQAFALHAGVKLDLFSLLAEGPQTASQAAARIGTQERSLATLLNALGAMGLVHKNGDRYAAAE